MSVKDEKQRRIVRGDGKLTAPLAEDSLFARDRNIIVRAGAGSGKTTVLVERMVAIVRSGISVDKLAAITFTRKAAGELRGRFFELLFSVAAELENRPRGNSSDPTEREFELEHKRVIAALDGVESVFIDTIHAFCLRLLRERPFEADLAPDFQLIDDREEERLRRSYWNNYLTRTLSSDTDWRTRFDRIGVSPGELFDYFGTRCRFSHMRVRRGIQEKPDLVPALRAVKVFIDRTRMYLSTQGAIDRFTACVVRADRFLAVKGVDEPCEQAAFLGLFDELVNEGGSVKKGVVQPTKWSKTRSDPAFQFATSLLGASGQTDDEQTIASLVMRQVRPALVRWRQWIFDPIESIVFPAVEGYARHRRASGKQTFDDLLRNTVRLLTRSSEVRRHFTRRFDRVLVDEFQDTDPLQAEILFLLTSEDPGESDWRRCRPRDGSLFIVGDDKQSIYRFRHADVRVFDECGRLIESTGGISIRLTSNFRSDTRICSWNNRAIRGLFEASEAPFQAAYEDLVAADDSTGPGPAVLQIVTDRVTRHSPSTIARCDASRIAGIISNLVSGNRIPLKYTGEHENQPGDFEMPDITLADFMILVRSSNRMHLYAESLRAAGIRYVMAGGKSIQHTRILPPLLDLLDAAHNSSDPVPLLAFLRGPFSGISDAALYRYSLAKGRFFGKRNLPDGLPDADIPAFRGAFEMLSRTRRALETWPFSQALEWIVTEFGLLSMAASRDDGSAEAGAIFRIISLFRQLEQTGMHWSEAIDELRRVGDGERDIEGMTLEIGRGNAVRLLNIHQAKGLESKVVFLADPLPGSERHGVEVHVDRSGGETSVALPVLRRRKHTTDVLAEPVDWAEARETESRFSDAETDRLTYVAATRAESLLVISRYMGTSDRGTWKSLYPALDSDCVPVIGDVEPLDRVAGEERLDQMSTRLADVRDRVSGLKAPSYTRHRVSDLTETSPGVDDFADEWRGGQGRGYGRAIHRLFEYGVIRRSVAIDPEMDRRVATRLMEQELSGSLEQTDRFTDRAIAALDAFRDSDIWSEIGSSHDLFTEIPFSTRKEEEERPTLISGVIDLVYRV
ncbi:MAG: UvrD-helicase domain-containing protein [Bacteroidetes bacterium]|nr:UvrD-helicase domain-containing protein [Bacteroidota bacterium]